MEMFREKDGEGQVMLGKVLKAFSLYDEKIGGTLHVAVGSGYPETGSRNQSAVHWDFICDMRRRAKSWLMVNCSIATGNL